MRRLGLIGVLFLLVQLVPSPADAWFGYLARLSGPGEFTGVHFEMRLRCFGDRPDPGTMTAGEAARGGAVGVAWSFCPTDSETVKERRGSFDVGTSILWTDRVPEYANGQRITLVRVVPAFTWRAIRNINADVLDVGMGGGVYWITSPDFEPLTGVVLEPVRIDIHGPTKWATYDATNPLRWAAAINFRAYAVTFPRGFAPNAFNAVPEKAVRLPAEIVPAFMLTVNLHSLIHGAK